MNILAIVPARGGSKGIPGKNIKLLYGKPLIAYSIESAFKSQLINRIIVSTDYVRIAEISKNYNSEVIIRPNEISRDDSLTVDTISHVLNTLKKEGYFPDIVVLLQPTSPLRTPKDVDNAINLFIKNKDKCDSVVSVCEFEHSPYWALKIKNDYLTPIFSQEYLRKRRQELPISYIPNGAIFVSSPDKIRKYKSFYCPKTIPYIMPFDRSIDIDSALDFKLVELLLEEKNEANES